MASREIQFPFPSKIRLYRSQYFIIIRYKKIVVNAGVIAAKVRVGVIVYLACWGPTEGPSNADVALKAESGITPDCSPIGCRHHPDQYEHLD